MLILIYTEAALALLFLAGMLWGDPGVVKRNVSICFSSKSSSFYVLWCNPCLPPPLTPCSPVLHPSYSPPPSSFPPSPPSSLPPCHSFVDGVARVQAKNCYPVPPTVKERLLTGETSMNGVNGGRHIEGEDGAYMQHIECRIIVLTHVLLADATASGASRIRRAAVLLPLAPRYGCRNSTIVSIRRADALQPLHAVLPCIHALFFF